jgi:nitrate/TMAO reductase-like tetraheme cytochrome c subunit
MSIQLRATAHHTIYQVLFGLIAAIAVTHTARAEGGQRMAPLLPKYQQECGACHVAYPPGMLPPASWNRLMSKLGSHYGTDASLDVPTAKELETWLNANAGTYKRARQEPPQDRITRSAWFIREHDEVSAASWKLPAVKNASNCVACHSGANTGHFNEDKVRIPR